MTESDLVKAIAAMVEERKAIGVKLDALIEHARYVYRYTDLGTVNEAAGDLLHGLELLKDGVR